MVVTFTVDWTRLTLWSTAKLENMIANERSGDLLEIAANWETA